MAAGQPERRAFSSHLAQSAGPRERLAYPVRIAMVRPETGLARKVCQILACQTFEDCYREGHRQPNP
jgi:hypothetical protein